MTSDQMDLGFIYFFKINSIKMKKILSMESKHKNGQFIELHVLLFFFVQSKL